MGLDLNDLATTNAERCKRWHPETSEPWSLADWSNAMTGEAGEAANMVKKLRRIETRTDTGPWTHVVHSTGRVVAHDRDTQARILAKGIGLELADVVIYADLLAQELTRKYGGYDLSNLIVTKFNAVSHREGYPERLGLPYDQGGPARPGQEWTRG
jgi:NTP pyrophosphatase (non-canonical NTP hydrolase)